MERKGPLYVTGEHSCRPTDQTMRLSPVRRRVSTGRLSRDLSDCVAGLQSTGAVREYFPEKEGWVVGQVEPDSVPGLGGGGIRARRECTGKRTVEVIFGKDSHAMVVMPCAGPIGTPISNTEGMVVAPLGGEKSGIGVMKGRPIGDSGYLMFTAEYDDSRELQGVVVKYCGYLQGQVETVMEAKTKKGTGLIRPTRASIAIPAKHDGGLSEVYLRAESDGEDGGKKLILELNGCSMLTIRGLTDSMEIGQLFDMVRNEVRGALAEAETG